MERDEMAVQDDVEKADGIRPAQRPGSPAAADAMAAPTPERSAVGRSGSPVATDVLSSAAVDGLAELGLDGPDLDPTFRHSYSRDHSILVRRLRRIEGQVRGIERMIERREYCIDILQQTAALRAAVDSVALLILEDHVQGCVRTAAEQGDADRYIEEVLDVVRRALGKPVRTPRV
jgi:DNA-binding FrmR family transcriptional regulator